MEVTQTKGETFQIKSAKFYVSIATSSANGNIKLLEK